MIGERRFDRSTSDSIGIVVVATREEKARRASVDDARRVVSDDASSCEKVCREEETKFVANAREPRTEDRRVVVDVFVSSSAGFATRRHSQPRDDMNALTSRIAGRPTAHIGHAHARARASTAPAEHSGVFFDDDNSNSDPDSDEEVTL